MRTHQGNELTRNSPGNVGPLSSQLAEPLWTDVGLNRGSGARELISTFYTKTNKQSTGEERFVEPFPIIFQCEEKATATTARL